MKISDEAVVKATGKTWDEWRQLLSKDFSKKSSHKEIVAVLREMHGLSHWWAQEVTVDFERFSGKRKIGQTKDAGYQIGVRKTFDGSVEMVWDYLMSSEGISLWLGDISKVVLEKGKQFETVDGTSGEIRVFQPYHHIRLTWKLKDWEKASTLQIRVLSSSLERATVAIHHEKLKDGKVREQMRTHWQTVLDSISL